MAHNDLRTLANHPPRQLAGFFIEVIDTSRMPITVPVTQNTVPQTGEVVRALFDFQANLSNSPGQMEYFTSLQAIFCHPDLSSSW